MALLKLIIAGKILLVFDTGNITFIRNENSTKEVSINYSNGTGQILNAGQQLYSIGIAGNSGYLEITSKSTVTLSGSGVIVFNVTHFPTSTEANKSLSFIYDSSTVNLNLTYNSNPITTDIIIQIDNRIVRSFTPQDFTSAYSDYDNDAISQVAIFGDVTGYKYNGDQYIAGTYFAVSNSTLLNYTPLDQNSGYEFNNTWKAKDSQGNISIN